MTAKPPVAHEEPLHDSLLPLIEVTALEEPEPAVEPIDHSSVSLPLDGQDDDLQVLGVTVSRALFAILTDETRVHLQTLEYELTLMQFDTALPPSDAMVRASHTLCGIHRTAGFLEIGDFAGLLEGALMAVRRAGRTSKRSVGVFATAIQCLRTATLRLQAQSRLSPEELADQIRTRAQLQSLIAETGSRDLGVEVELIEQTHAEEQAFATFAPEPVPATVTLDFAAEPPAASTTEAAVAASPAVSPDALLPAEVEVPEPASASIELALPAVATAAAAVTAATLVAPIVASPSAVTPPERLWSRSSVSQAFPPH